MADRGGNFAIMFTIASFPLLAGIGMAMEYSNLTAQRAKLQNAVDAAILFAGRYLDQNDVLPAQADIEGFVDSNFDGPFTISQLDQSGGNLSLTVDATIPAFFFGAVYPDVFDQQVSASVPYGGKSYLEIAMVLDSTGSMKHDGKMVALKTVANEFVDKLEAVKNAKNDIRIGLVPFSNYVNVGPANKFESWVNAPGGAWGGCVGSRPAPDTLIDGSVSVPFPGLNPSGCPTPLVELSNSATDLKNGISAMNPSGWTYVGEGVMWGLRVLSAGAPFTDGVAFGSLPATTNHQKFLLVLTDGDNTRAPKLPGSSSHNKNDQSLADANTRAACQEARDAGVVVYSIVFGTSVSATGQAVMTDCAGDPKRYYTAANAAALQSAFTEILSQLVTLRLSS